MSSPQSPISLLRSIPASARPRTLAAIIEHGSEHDRSLFAPALAELALLSPISARPDAPPPEPIRACLVAWPWIPSEFRRLLAASDLDWPAAASALLETAEPMHRSRLASAARDLPGVLALQPRLLSDPDAGVVQTAARGLFERAAEASQARDHRRAVVLARVLTQALDTFDTHRQRPVIEAVWMLLESPAFTLSLGEPGKALLRWLRTSRDASRSAARTVLRTGEHRWLRARAIAWLAEPATQAAAIDRLSRATDHADHECTLLRAHLLARPTRARVLGLLSPVIKPVNIEGKAVRRPIEGGPVPNRAHVQDLSPRAARALPGYLGLLGITSSDRAMAAEPLLVSDDPRTRLALARMLDDAAARDLLFDPHPLVSRHAAYRWSLAGVASQGDAKTGAKTDADRARLRQARRLERAPSPLVRRVASDQADRLDFLRWPSPMARVQARRLLLRDRSALVSQLRDALANTDDDKRLRAAMVAASLGLGSDLREPLTAILLERKASDPVASTAVRALLRSPDADAELTSAALTHPDPRVRANTIEELARGGADGVRTLEDQLESWLSDRAHRLRAAAVRAALAEPKLAPVGKSALLDMLSDDRAMHRVSGAWLACRARAVDAAAILRDLALRDHDSAVRARADWALRRLASPTMKASA